MSNKEKRFVTFTSRAEIRATADGHGVVRGYAAVTGVATDLGNGVTETIKPGAFRRTLAEGADVRALINHDDNLVLGRTKSGTLTLREDAKGLYFECELPNTTFAQDLRESVMRGDVDQCSFGFYCVADSVEYMENGTIHRTVQDLDLFDISVVTYPAYPTTSVSARNRNADTSTDVETLRLKLRLAALTN